MHCLNIVIWFSQRAPIDIQCAERYTELSHIIAQGPWFGKKDRFERESPQHWNDWAYQTRMHACANVSFYIISLSIGRLIPSEVC